MFQGCNTKWFITAGFKHTLAEFKITSGVLTHDESNPSEATMAEHMNSPNIFSSEEIGYKSSTSKKCHYQNPILYSRISITTTSQMVQIGINHYGFRDM